MSADWAQQQAEAKSKKERILGELQSLVRGSSHDYETTNRFKAKSGEFFAAGYAGKADNDRLKAAWMNSAQRISLRSRPIGVVGRRRRIR